MEDFGQDLLGRLQFQSFGADRQESICLAFQGNLMSMPPE
jgi:hypothetical protein